MHALIRRLPALWLLPLLLCALAVGGCEDDDATAESANGGSGQTASGFPDTSFGSLGIGFVPLQLDTGFSVGESLALNSNGKIAVAGFGMGPATPSASDDFVLWQLENDGDPDPSFNGSGRRLYENGINENDNARGVAFNEKTDAIYIAGKVDNTTFGHIRSYTKSGGTGFGGIGGFTQTNSCGAPTTSSIFWDVLVQPHDNKIVVVGADDDQIVVIRFNPDGSLDSANFANATGGLFCHTFGGTVDTAFRVALDSLNRIVLVGESSTSGPPVGSSIFIMRLMPDGTLDGGFNGSGFNFASSPLGGTFSGAYGLAIDKKDRILIAGYADNGTNTDAILWRFTKTGPPDLNFGGTGYVTIGDIPGNPGNQAFQAVAIDAKNRVIAVGDGPGLDPTGQMDIYLARFREVDGNLDDSFGALGLGPGLIFVNFGDDSPTNELARDVKIDRSGRIVMVGSFEPPPLSHMGVWRFQ